LKKLQHCGKKKKAEVHGRAPPRGCPVGIRGEGPGKTKMSVTHSKKEVALAKRNQPEWAARHPQESAPHQDSRYPVADGSGVQYCSVGDRVPAWERGVRV